MDDAHIMRIKEIDSVLCHEIEWLNSYYEEETAVEPAGGDVPSRLDRILNNVLLLGNTAEHLIQQL